jgi:ParB family chromosome partitioning protein
LSVKTRNLGLTAYDDMFQTDESREELKQGKIQQIPLSEIDNFPDHPFRVENNEEMQRLVDSIKQNGVHTPALARQKEDGRYELISGHRRKMACELVGLDKMPVIVREMSLDEATICMVDSNLQREELLYSEKAFSYRMRLEAMKRQAGRPSQDNYSPMANNLQSKTSSAELAEILGTSKDQVFRFIRLTELIPEVLKKVDEKLIAFRPAVELSYLPKEQQKILLDTIECEDCTPSLAQAIKMKQFSQEGRLNEDVIFSIISEEKPNQKELFKMPRERISKFFPEGTSADKIEDTIVKALEFYKKRQREQER